MPPDQQRKVLIVDANLLHVLEAEKCLRSNGYGVARLSSPAGVVAKIEYESPDILLIDLDMEGLQVDAVFDELREQAGYDELVVVLFSERDGEELREVCVTHDFHGYFCKSMGIDQLPAFLDNFYDDSSLG